MLKLGFVENGKPVAGGIYYPATKEIFLGTGDAGVLYNGKPAGPSSCTTLDGAVVLASRSEVKRGEWQQFENAPCKIQAMGTRCHSAR